MTPELVDLAMGDFRTFVAKAGYHRQGLRQEDYFLVNGELPQNISLLRYEEISTAFPAAVKSAASNLRNVSFPHLNSSDASARALVELLDAETRELLYQKHRYIFDQGYYSLSGGY